MQTTLVTPTALKMPFLYLPSIFRRPKSTADSPKEQTLSKEERNTTTIKDIFPVTRHTTTSVKKQYSKKEKSSIETTTTSTISTVPKRKSPRKKKIDATFRGLSRSANQPVAIHYWTEDKSALESTTPRENTVEEGVATAAAAKLLLEATQRMQGQKSVDSRITMDACPQLAANNPSEQPPPPPPQQQQQEERLSNSKVEKTSADRVLVSTDTFQYTHQILEWEEEVFRWQQVMLDFLASKSDSTKAKSLESFMDNNNNNEIQQQQQPWEQLIQQQQKHLVSIKELIEKAKVAEQKRNTEKGQE